MAFTVEAPAAAPHVDGLTPDHGLPGASVAIAGSGFGATQGTSSVKFGATAAAVTGWSAGTIVCRVPDMASGRTSVVVTVGALTSKPVAFTVEAPAVAPHVDGLTPDHGLPGASVIIAGSGFGATQGASSVKFGATVATVFSWSAASIACQVPALPAGASTVAVTVGGLSSNAVMFSVEAPPVVPTLTLQLSGLQAGVLKLGRRVTAECTLAPSSLAGASCAITVQRKTGHRWFRVKQVTRTIGPSGAFSWKYKPPTRGRYRMQATMAATAQHTSAETPWHGFRVK